jgi:hypothetical protein
VVSVAAAGTAWALGQVAEVALLPAQFVEDLPQLAAGHHDRPYRQPGGRPYVVKGQDVGGIGDADNQFAVVHRQPEDAVPQHQRQRDAGDGGLVDRVPDEVDHVNPVRLGAWVSWVSVTK